MNHSNQNSQRIAFVLHALICLCVPGLATAQTFHELPPIADAEGFAAPYVGVSGSSLIVAGGANFPDKPRWQTGKVWYDSIFILDTPNGEWRKSKSKLPRPLAYGLSFNLSKSDRSLALSIPHGVLCIGGGDSKEHIADCFILTLTKNGMRISKLPSLPAPLANTTGILHEGVVYVLGGLHSPTSDRPAQIFWKLDLTNTSDECQWEELSPWPGNPRMLAVAGVINNTICLFSGTDLVKNQDGSMSRKYLKDGFAYDLKTKQWRKTATLPRPAVAAPTPAITTNNALLVVSGDHGEFASQTELLKDKHPGFPAGVLAYNPQTDSWSKANDFPKDVGEDPAGNPHGGIWPPVVTNITHWHGQPVIVCGEVRPRVRSRRAFMVKF